MPSPDPLNQSFERLQQASRQRQQRRTELTASFSELTRFFRQQLGRFDVYLVDSWMGGFRFDLRGFHVALQLADFDDGHLWQLTVWLRHKREEAWQRVDAGDLFLPHGKAQTFVLGGQGISWERGFLAITRWLERAIQQYGPGEPVKDDGDDDDGDDGTEGSG